LTKLIGINGEESMHLASLRDTVLPRLISGEIRVNNMERFSTFQQGVPQDQ